ncbi:hypothetical protein [Zunongwangia endophytica]|uniref:DUF4468 domain-containing protein n=1 Tax=Zunongwangia endophytica TaxID=1808945 RepID=A0ABV8H8W2_9FLAO|nr:hypothetical protein [Zunongwangia endophytica]MDN3595286.1 hypothetical protein [Zunongwangia endophytica]
MRRILLVFSIVIFLPKFSVAQFEMRGDDNGYVYFMHEKEIDGSQNALRKTLLQWFVSNHDPDETLKIIENDFIIGVIEKPVTEVYGDVRLSGVIKYNIILNLKKKDKVRIWMNNVQFRSPYGGEYVKVYYAAEDMPIKDFTVNFYKMIGDLENQQERVAALNLIDSVDAFENHYRKVMKLRREVFNPVSMALIETAQSIDEFLENNTSKNEW